MTKPVTTSLAYQVSLTLSDHADDFDIPGIVTELRQTFGPALTDIDDAPFQEYWEIVKRHDTTGGVDDRKP